MSDDIKIEGLDKLLSLLDSMTRESALEKGIEDACVFVEGQAKENLQKHGITDSSELAGSITHKVDGNYGEVGTNKEYGPYVEFGTGIHAAKGDGRQTPWVYWNERAGHYCYTVGQYPKPFLYPALEDHLPEVRELIFKGVLKEVRKK